MKLTQLRVLVGMLGGVAFAVGCDQSGTALTAADAGAKDSGTPDAVGKDSGTTDGGESEAGDGDLTSLSVSPLPMYPPFLPDTHDYYVRCAAGANDLKVTMVADPGGSARLTAPVQSPSAEAQTVQVTVDEGQAMVVTPSGGASKEYWIRCLPHDFPRISLTTFPENGAPTPGYYLLGSATNATDEGVYAMILDGNATPVWYRPVPTSVVNVDLQPDGQLSYMKGGGTFGSDPTSDWQLIKLDPWTVSQVSAVGAATDFHELQTLSNGNHYVTSYPAVTNVDLTGLGKLGPSETIANCVVQEIDPSGSVVWQWKATDHIDPVKETTDPASGVIGLLPVVDVFHCNSVETYDATHVMISSRHMDSVFLVDKTTGKIVWKMGGTPYSKDGAQLIAVKNDPETAFYHQHDARLLPSGHISLFDDHTTQTGAARGVEYALDLTAGTATMVTQFPGPTGSAAMGSFRQYADGTILVGWGLAFANSLVFTEFNSKGKELLHVTFAQGSSSYRAVKAPLSAFDIDVLRATVGHP